jgi:hypothetical protein
MATVSYPNNNNNGKKIGNNVKGCAPYFGAGTLTQNKGVSIS